MKHFGLLAVVILLAGCGRRAAFDDLAKVRVGRVFCRIWSGFSHGATTYYWNADDCWVAGGPNTPNVLAAMRAAFVRQHTASGWIALRSNAALVPYNK